MYRNVHIGKTAFKGKFTVLNACVINEQRSKICDLRFDLNRKEKKSKLNPK